MLDGLKSGFDTFKIAMRVACEIGANGSDQGVIEGFNTSFYEVDSITVSSGVSLTCQSVARVGPLVIGKHATLDIPDLGVSQTYFNATPGDFETRVVFNACRVIHYPSGSYAFTITGIDWYVNGGLHWSTGASFTLVSGISPFGSAVPLFGAGFRLEGSIGHANVPPMGCGSFPATPDVSENTGILTGGVEFELDGAWRSVPIEIMPHAASGIVSGTDSNNITINVENSSTVTTTSRTFTIQNGALTIVPNESAAVIRMNDDYEALIPRWGFPQVVRYDRSGTSYNDCTGEPTSGGFTTTDTELYPLDTLLLSTVGLTSHVIETPMTRTKYSLVVCSRDTIVWTASGGSETVDASGFYPGFDTSTINPNFKNTDPTNGWLSTYFNTIVTPQSSYGLFLPPDSGSFHWQLNGADSPIELWESKTRQQHIQHPSLPSDENTMHRVSNVSDAFGGMNALSGVALTFVGSTGFWGVDRISVSDITGYPASLPTDETSAPRFSTPTIGGSVVVDPTGITI